MKIEIYIDEKEGKALRAASALMGIKSSAIVSDAIAFPLKSMLKHIAKEIKKDEALNNAAKSTGQPYQDLMEYL